MNYQLEQALLDDESRQFLFKLEDKISSYLSEIQKAENGSVEGIQYFNLKNYEKMIITKILEYYRLTSKVVYVKVSSSKTKTSQDNSNLTKNPQQQEGSEDNATKAKKKKKKGILIFRNAADLSAPVPVLKLRDYFTSSQLSAHADIVEQKKRFKKKKNFSKKVDHTDSSSVQQSEQEHEHDLDNENGSSSIEKDEDCSLSSASSNTGTHSKDESQNSSRHKIEASEEQSTTSEKSNTFLPNLAHILCLIKKKNNEQDNQFSLNEWIDSLGMWKYTLRSQSEFFSFIVMESDAEAQQFEAFAKQANDKEKVGLIVTPLSKLDREELKNEYLDQTIQKPKASVEVANRIIFGILGERKEIKNNSGDIMKRLVNKD